MTTVIALGEIRNQQKQRQSRERLHELFDNWLNHLEEVVNKAEPTLVELTQAVLSMREELTQAVTASFVERKYAALHEQKTASCPICGATLRARGPMPRTVSTLSGEIELHRRIFTVRHAKTVSTRLMKHWVWLPVIRNWICSKRWSR
jgi:hypothetical protein